MRHPVKKLSPAYGLALIVIGVVVLIASHWFECRLSNFFSLLSILAVMGGIIVYVVAYRAREKY